MKKWMSYALLLLMFCYLSMPMVSADVGPKPSITLEFEGLGDEEYYITILSKYDSTGPKSVYDGKEKPYQEDPKMQKIWQKFVDYQDPDGFYYLQVTEKISSSSPVFDWSYRPPRTFKILLYSETKDQFITDHKIYDAKVFYSVYKVMMENGKISQVTDEYNYGREVLFFFIRVILTLLVELGIALLFGFCKKKQLQIIMGVNILTQVLLNIGLSYAYIRTGEWFIFFYVFLELLVIIIEAILFVILFKRIPADSENKISSVKIVLYSIIANILSFGTGMGISLWLVYQSLPVE